MNTNLIKANNLPEEELFYGHKACAGCGGALAVRLALKVLGPRTFVVVPANCMSAVGFLYPVMPFFVNALASAFACTGAVMSGLEAGLRRRGITNFNVVGFAGDGGTADIGLQSLSGAIDRHDHVIYICYDNEAYMNTGVQESGLTPFGAKTTTSPVGKKIQGALSHKKSIFEMVAANNIDYAATASIGYPLDYMNKVRKAKTHNGTSFIHVMAPCPTGWSLPTNQSISIAKEAVECGLWYLAEYENDHFTLNKKLKEFTSVEEYLKKQGRFKHLKKEQIDNIVACRDKKWEKINEIWH